MSSLALQQHDDFFPDVEEMSRALALISQKHVFYYPSLNKLTGNHKAGLMLGLLLYWSRYYYVERPEREGWFYKTQQEWQLDTGLSRHEQDSARECLQSLGILQVQRRGMPARTYYRLSMDRLGAHLCQAAGITDFVSWDWTNGQRMFKMLGKPVAFYLKLAGLADSATSAIYLSYLLYLQRGHLTAANTPEWLTPRTDIVTKQLGMSYKVQLSVRKKLTSMGLIDTRIAGKMCPTTLIRVRFSRITDLLSNRNASLGQKLSTIQKSVDNSVNSLNNNNNDAINSVVRVQGMPKPANRDLPNRQTGNSQTGKQGMPESANKDLPNRQSSLPKREDSIYNKNNTLLPLLQTETGNAQSGKLDASPGLANKLGDPNGGGGVVKLEFEGIDAIWQNQATALVQQLPMELQQAVIDEWIGRFNNQIMTKLNMPLNWLRTLTAKAKNGEFDPQLGIQVAKDRIKKARAIKAAHQANQAFSADLPNRQTEHQSQKPAWFSDAAAAFKRGESGKQFIPKELAIKGLQGVGASNTPEVSEQVVGRVAGQAVQGLQGVGASNTPEVSEQIEGRVTGEATQGLQGVGASNTPEVSEQIEGRVTGHSSAIRTQLAQHRSEFDSTRTRTQSTVNLNMGSLFSALRVSQGR